MERRRTEQRSRALPKRAGWGGRRANAGRKPKGPQAGVSHRRRARFADRQPFYVTLRLRSAIGDLRGDKPYGAVHAALCAARAEGRPDFRVIHYSVQSNHLHFIVEADRKAALSRGMQGLVIRVARKLNAAKGQTGRVFADRYDATPLGTPRQTRACLAHVLNDARRHAAQEDATYPKDWLDPCSSAEYFDGWRDRREPPRLPAPGDAVARPRTSLLRSGWRKAGLIATDEIPGPPTWAKGLDAGREVTASAT